MKKILLALSFMLPMIGHAQCDIDFNYFVSNDTLSIFGFSNDTSSATGQYNWYLNYKPVGSGQHVVLYDVQPGYYNIYLLGDSECSKSKNIKLGNFPCQVNQFTYTINDLTVDFDFNNLNIDSLFFIYSWDFGDGSSATGWYESHSYQEPGSYLVTLYKEGPDTCSISQYIEVGQPSCNIDFDFAISGNTVSFNSLVLPGDTSSFRWVFGDSSSIVYGRSASHTYSRPGSYQVLLTRISPQGECSIAKTITIDNSIQSSPLSGTITFDSYAPIDDNIISIYSVDGTFQFERSLTLDTGLFYINLPHGNYLILVTPHTESVFFNNAAPTFYGNTTNWQTASILQHNGNQSISIKLQAAPELSIPDPVWLSGSDLIEGYIYESNPNERKLANTGFENVMVTLYNELGQKLSVTFTDSDGKYAFSNLIAGTYTLQITYPGNNETITLDVTLDGDAETLEDIAPLNWAKEYIILSASSEYRTIDISLIPNPVVEILKIKGPAVSFNYEIISATGTTVSKGTANSEATVNMINMPEGVYLVRIHSSQGSIVKQVVKR